MRAGLFVTCCVLAACGDDNDADYRVLATMSTSGSCESAMAVLGDRLVIGAELWDISDPAAPDFLHSFGELGEPLHVEGDDVWLLGTRSLVVRDGATADLHRLDLPGNSFTIAATLTDDAVVVLAEDGNYRSSVVTFDRATLPATGVPLPAAILPLPGKRSSVSQSYGGDLAARGDLIVVGGNPSALAIDVSDPYAPVITDQRMVAWGTDGDPIQSSLWAGFDGAGDLVLLHGGRPGGGPRITTISVSDDGELGEAGEVVELASEGRGKGPIAITDDAIFTGAGLYRRDGSFLGTTPAFTEFDGPCGFASDGERFYVHVINRGVSVVEVP